MSFGRITAKKFSNEHILITFLQDANGILFVPESEQQAPLGHAMLQEAQQVGVWLLRYCDNLRASDERRYYAGDERQFVQGGERLQGGERRKNTHLMIGSR